MKVFCASLFASILFMTVQLHSQDGVNISEDPVVAANVPILQAERELSEMFAHHDVAELSERLSRTWQMIRWDGSVLSRQQVLEAIKDGTLRFAVRKVRNLTVRTYGQMAIVTGIVEAQGDADGEAFESVDRFSDVFILVNNDWRCVSTQFTPILE